MKYLSIGLLLTFSFNIFANDIVIYRWVDVNGVAHFSHNQPISGEYTELLMSNSNIPSAIKHKETSQKKVTVPKELATSDNLSVDASIQCEEAKKNLSTLTDFARIRFVDVNGETQILDETQQKEQITINEKRIEVYCK